MEVTAIQVVIALLGLALAGAVALATCVVFIVRSITASEDKMRAFMEKEIAQVGTARHDLRNELTAPFIKFESRLETLEKEAVRRSELTKLETQVSAEIGEMKRVIERLFQKLEPLPVIERDVKALAEQMRSQFSKQGAD